MQKNGGYLFSKVLLISALFVVLVFGSVSLSNAGTIFVSGDTNIVNPLVGSFGTSVDPGNERFFQNILQGGSTVVIHGDHSGGGSTANADAEINSFYNSLAGVSSSVFGGTITAGMLTGADLFVSILPDNAFTASEIAAMAGFSGDIFFLGENNNFTAQNGRINAALTGLGSNLSIVNDLFDSGFHTATGSQIATDLFTTGVSTFTYGAPSEVPTVAGGTALFFGTGGKSFLAYDTTAVPEPSTLLLLGSALAGLGLVRRRFKS